MRELTDRDKFRIACRDKFTCQFCGAMPGNDQIEIDHLIPISRGGSDNAENLVALCKKCNRGKSDAIAFPPSLIAGPDRRGDEGWLVHKSFGEWEIKFHEECGMVLEFTPLGYWVGQDRCHESDWENHVYEKDLGPQHRFDDFLSGLEHFRKMIRNERK